MRVGTERPTRHRSSIRHSVRTGTTGVRLREVQWFDYRPANRIATVGFTEMTRGVSLRRVVTDWSPQGPLATRLGELGHDEGMAVRITRYDRDKLRSVADRNDSSPEVYGLDPSYSHRSKLRRVVDKEDPSPQVYSVDPRYSQRNKLRREVDKENSPPQVYGLNRRYSYRFITVPLPWVTRTMAASKSDTNWSLQIPSVEGCGECERHARLAGGLTNLLAILAGGPPDPLDLFVDNVMALVDDRVELAGRTLKHAAIVLNDKQTIDLKADFGIAKSNLIQACKAHAAGSYDISLLLVIGKSREALHNCSAFLVELGYAKSDAVSSLRAVDKLAGFRSSLPTSLKIVPPPDHTISHGRSHAE
jgi:hypothetical protein